MRYEFIISIFLFTVSLPLSAQEFDFDQDYQLGQERLRNSAYIDNTDYKTALEFEQEEPDSSEYIYVEQNELKRSLSHVRKEKKKFFDLDHRLRRDHRVTRGR